MKRASFSVVAAVAVGAVLLVLRKPAPIAPPVAMTGSVPTAAPAGYEIISDEELIATLRDRPLLVLPQENGTKKIVLLDR